jgi:hypothetical protein
MGERGKPVGERPGQRPRKGIKLRSTKQLQLEAARKADGKETRNFLRRKPPDVSRIGFHLGRLHTEQKGQAVMEGTNIGHPNNQVPPQTEFERDLVTDPEEFLEVFENLVGDKEIDTFVCER